MEGVMTKKELIAELAKALHGYGFTVYIAKSGDYGFYTDGKSVVSFGGYWKFSIDFSGNYKPINSADGKLVGTGWQIDKEVGIPTLLEASDYLNALPPRWATDGLGVVKTTPEQHLKTYGVSSGYTLYEAHRDQP
jgi:hypothetical protein